MNSKTTILSLIISSLCFSSNPIAAFVAPKLN